MSLTATAMAATAAPAGLAAMNHLADVVDAGPGPGAELQVAQPQGSGQQREAAPRPRSRTGSPSR